MKRLFMYALLLVALAGIVSATLTVPTQLALGSSSQQKSNPDEDENQPVSKTFTIQNTGTTTVSNIALASTVSDASYNISVTPTSISELAVGSSQIITVRGRVPEGIDTFDSGTGDPKVVSIGGITVSATGETTRTVALTMQAENNLQLSKIYISIDGSNRKSYDDGDTVEEIQPGDKLTFEFKVENAYSSGDNVDFDNVEIEIESQDSDFDDIDDSVDFGGIDAGDESTETYSFTVDPDIDEETYTVYFTLTGEDDPYGSSQGEQWRIDFEVKKEDEDIRIKSATLSPESVKCDRDVVLSVDVENLGGDDSDEVVLQWESSALNIKDNDPQIDLNEGDNYRKSIPLTISDTQKAGTYTVRVTTYFNYDDFESRSINDVKDLTIKVEDCISTIVCYKCEDYALVSDEYQATSCPTGWSLTIPKCAAPQNVTVVTPTTPITPSTPTGAVPAQVTYKPARSDMLYIGLMVLGYIIVILIGIGLISYVVRKR